MIAAYRRTHSPSHFAWSEARQPLGAVVHSLHEPRGLSQRLYRGDSTTDSFLGINTLYCDVMTNTASYCYC